MAPLASLAGSTCPTVSIYSGITATLVFLGVDVLTGPKRVEVVRDAVTMRGPAMVAGCAGLLSVTTASMAVAVGLGVFVLTIRIGMATGVFRLRDASGGSWNGR